MNAIKEESREKYTNTKIDEVKVEETIDSSRPFLSVVIPCYNCRDTIERLMDSLVVQEFPSLEVIVQDDYSTDNFMELVEPYKEKLNIKYFKNKEREMHCPSNTRLDGMSHATGIWITFIDNDDAFEPGAFNEVKKCAEITEEKRLIVSYFREYIAENDWYGKIYDETNSSTWLHGKFYYLDFLRENNITFQENLESHEDLMFNQNVYSYLVRNAANNSLLKFHTYKWIYNPNSLSRRMFQEEFYYIDQYYGDYIDGSANPWIRLHHEIPNVYDEFIFNRLSYMALTAYFYYQSLYYRRGFIHYRPNRNLFENFINKIKDEFGKTNDDICRIVYSDEKKYNDIRDISINGCAYLAERESFYTFINRF